MPLQEPSALNPGAISPASRIFFSFSSTPPQPPSFLLAIIDLLACRRDRFSPLGSREKDIVSEELFNTVKDIQFILLAIPNVTVEHDFERKISEEGGITSGQYKEVTHLK